MPNVLNYDLIIFSTWTDYMNIPKKMIDFIKNIKGQNKFSIALSTYGGVSGQTISNLKKLIKSLIKFFMLILTKIYNIIRQA